MRSIARQHSLGFAGVLTVSLFSLIAPGRADNYPFRLTLESHLLMDIGGQKQDMVAHTELDYTWQHEGNGRALMFDSMGIRAVNNGKEMMATSMSHDKVSVKQGGQTTEILYKDAPEQLKTTMQDSFGVTVFKRLVNEQGLEASHETTAKPGAKDLVDNGIIVNGLLFHPLPPTGKAEWDAETQVSMGNGGYAKGKLTYKKVDGKPGEVYAVSGTLTNDLHERAGSPVSVKNAKYVVSGEQTYEPVQKEWVSGKLQMEVAFEMSAQNKVMGTAKGSMEASMERRGK